MFNYSVPAGILKRYLPPHTELDLWQGNATASLVGFLFADTRVLGISWPGHTTFAEVNLRFYIKYLHEGEWRRGVAFISEIVPRPVISMLANSLFNEKYSYMPMEHAFLHSGNDLQVNYRWKHRNAWNSMSVEVPESGALIAGQTEEEFIFEHYFGYNRLRDGVSIEYPVFHPTWKTRPVSSFSLDCDIESLYGPEFKESLLAAPGSVFFAEGSDVTVGMPRQIFS